MVQRSVAKCLLAFGLLTGAQATPTRAELDATHDAQYTVIEQQLAKLKLIEGDMLDMRKHVAALEGSAQLRSQQIKSLRLRHPSISLTDDASAQRIYTALYKLRSVTQERIRPLLVSVRRYEHRERCTTIRSSEAMRSRIENSPEFLKQSLAERADAAALFDALTDDKGLNGPCVPTDYLPEEVSNSDSLARAERRYNEGRARLQRIKALTERPE